MQPIDRILRASLLLAAFLASAAVWWPAPAQAARIKEVASVQGVRTNQLVGYGLVVGLDGTGDQTTQAPFAIAEPAGDAAADGRHRAARHATCS